MKCKDCKKHGSDFLTTYAGMGMFKFDYCNVDPAEPRVVDADVDRDCQFAEELKPEVKI